MYVVTPAGFDAVAAGGTAAKHSSARDRPRGLVVSYAKAPRPHRTLSTAN